MPAHPRSRRDRLWLTALERRDVPATYTVTSPADGADTVAGTLRWAVTQANASAGTPDTITFALGGPATITLAATLPTVTDGVTIQGPGAVSLTVSGGAIVRPFAFGSNSAAVPAVHLSGVTVADGRVTDAGGGGLAIAGASVTLTAVAFRDNNALVSATTGAYGGAIDVSGSAAQSLAITDCTFTNNSAGGSGYGGAIAVRAAAASLAVVKSLFAGNGAESFGYGGAISLTTPGASSVGDSTFTSNSARGGGGAVYAGVYGSLTVAGSRFTNNVAGSGGAMMLYQYSGGSVSITASEFVGNHASSEGGAVVVSYGTTCTVSGSLFRDNVAAGGSGGAIVADAPTVVRNSTLVNNTAVAGGAVSVRDGSMSLVNSTVARNVATRAGGGIAARSAVTLTSSVVALNAAPFGPDVAPTAGTLAVSATASLVGTIDPTRVTIAGSGTLSGTLAAPLNPALGPLADNGGPFATMLPLAGSPLLDAGSNSSTLTFDNRGPGFPRQVGAKVDIGAAERTPDGVPSAAVVSAPVVRVGSVAATQPYTFAVRYADDAAVKAASADGDLAAVTVTGPGGFQATVTAAVATPAADAAAVTVTYMLAPPPGGFAAVGQYTIGLTGGAVQNWAGQSVPAATLGTFRVAAALTLTVTTTADSGPGSLREAIAQANATVGEQETITFALATPATITLTGGPLTVSGGVTIQGPGADLLRLRGFGNRILNVTATDYVGTAVSAVTLADANGTGTFNASGGAVYVGGDSLTLTAVRITNNAAVSGGSAVYATAGTTVAIVDSTVTNNANGAIAGSSAWLTVTRSLFTDNTTAANGGAVSTIGGSLAVVDSVFANNRSASTAGGGGAVACNNGTYVTLTNATFANNTAAGPGGAVRMLTAGGFTVNNSTFVGNTAGGGGGAIALAGTATITSSIVAGNTGSASGPNLFNTSSSAKVAISNSALGDTIGFVFGTNSKNIVGQNLKLSPLRPNGGPFPVVSPLAGSPVIDAGSNSLGLTTDGRGFARQVGTAADIGAVERDGPTLPGGTATAAAVTAAGSEYTFTVTYTDETAVSAASASGNLAAVRVVAPGGGLLPITAAVASSPSDTTPLTVTYTATPPGGAWDVLDNGTYTVAVNGGQVRGAVGQFAAAAALTTFTVAVPGSFVVTTTADSGPGSLRQAILDANATSAADTIRFADAFTGPQTITLTSGPLPVTAPLSIAPASALTLVAGTANRLMAVSGPGTFAVAVANLTFAGGRVSDNGGAVSVADESVTFTACRFINNAASVSGGAVYTTAAPAMAFVGCSFVGNTATDSGGAVAALATAGTVTVTDCTFTANGSVPYRTVTGGAVAAGQGATLTVTGSTFMDNVAALGGALAVNGGALLVGDSALVRNTATVGGAVYESGFTTTITMTNTTLARNTAQSDGGAMFTYSFAPLTFRNCTVVQNTAGGVAGAVGFGYSVPSIKLTSTVVGDNTSATGRDFDVRSTNFTGPIALAAVTASAIGNAAFLSVPYSPTNLPLNTPLNLSPVLDTTGMRPAVVPAPGSPLIDAGANPVGLTTDGRGFARQVGAAVDIGAAERVPGPSVVNVSFPAVTGPASTYQFTVTYADDSGAPLAAGSLTGNTAAVSLTGPGGSATVVAATPDVPTDGLTRTVTYTVIPPGGAWDGADFGTYSLTVNANQAKNTAGAAVPAAAVSSLTVRYARALTVTSLLDDGSPGTLRWAAEAANAGAVTLDTVTFAPGLSGTINLGSQIKFTDGVVLSGAGAAVTVTGAVGVFSFSQPGAAAVADLAIRGAMAVSGAAITVSSSSSLTLDRMVIADNTTTNDGSGGAVSSYGTLVINDSTLSNNVGRGSGTRGGAVAGSGSMTLNRCVVVGNRAAVGGAVENDSSSLTVVGCLFADNTATVRGGAVAAGWTPTLRNSTFVGNAAGVGMADGRGGVLYAGAGTARLDGCTVVGNVARGAAGQGGAVYVEAAGLTVTGTVLAGNAAATGPDLFRVAGGTGTVTLGNSLIGVGDSGFTGATETALLKGTLAAPLDPQLGPLQANGGPTLSRLPLPGSPVIDAGANPTNTPFDQRGIGYARVYGAAADIGAVEVQPPPVPDVAPPVVAVVYQQAVTRLSPGVWVDLSIADSNSPDPASISAADFALVGPAGSTGIATSFSMTGTNPLTISAYFPAPGGTWTADDNGTYSVSVTGTVLDTAGNAAAYGAVATVTAAVPVGVASVVALLPDGTTTPLSSAGQRSSIPAVRVLFDGPATGADVAAAYKLVTGTTTVPLTVTTALVAGRTQATLTPAATLADGKYTLTVFGTAVTTANLPGAVQLDGDNNGTAGGNATLSFTRFLTDFDGDGAVDGNDLAIFAQAFNSVDGDSNYRCWLDLDGDGAVDGNDLAIFAQRFNMVF